METILLLISAVEARLRFLDHPQDQAWNSIIVEDLRPLPRILETAPD